MTEQPILFQGEMVRAIREGRKTVTRRLRGLAAINSEPDLWAVVSSFDPGPYGIWAFTGKTGNQLVRCPYGVSADHLWTRETFCDHDFKLGGSRLYRADGEFLENWTARGLRWKPAIHMPRDWSRNTLEVVNARPERLQAITEEDAIAEGCEECRITDADINEAMENPLDESKALMVALGPGVITAKAEYLQLWDSINRKKLPWSKNPWVWRVEFRVL